MITRLATHLDLTKIEAEVICVYGKPQNNWMEREILEHGIPINDEVKKALTEVRDKYSIDFKFVWD